MDAPTVGLVIRVDRKQCTVEVDGKPVTCAIRGRFFEDPDQEARPVAIGDRVHIQPSDQLGTIEAILPRRNQILRRAPRSAHKVQVIATNLDLLIIVATLREPLVRPSLIDRLLVEGESAGIDVAIVINKVDLVSPDEIREVAEIYEPLGYSVLPVSATQKLGLTPLEQLMNQRLSLVLGPSGVGKSSLLNALDPSLELKVGAVRQRDGKGKHTTTAYSLLHLGFGGDVVDAPGIREFGLIGIEPADLGAYFRDIQPFHTQCRFARCTHDHEPSCAVKTAVAEQQVREDRYASYRRLLEYLQGDGERMPRHGSF